MGPIFKEFDLGWAYRLAAQVRTEIFQRPGDGWLASLEEGFWPVDADFKSRALAPSKKTFLHDIIRHCFVEGIEYYARKGDAEVVEEELCKLLKAYRVAIPARIAELSPLDDDADEPQRYVDDLRDLVIQHCAPHVTQEVFTILFADRALLLQFNQLIAESIEALKASDHPELLETDGVVRRCTYLPVWLKSALVYRDRGRCALCLVDLSGLLAAGSNQHIDHVVPLSNGGTNDPTNLQYLCEQCNLHKGGGEAITSRFYSPYWDEDER